MSDSNSFPRRQAITRRFTLGAPRDIGIGVDGERVAFLRSSGPEDPINGLWVFDVDTSVERLVADPRHLSAAEADLPPSERARRERARESAGGIVAFDTNEDLTFATFALGGQVGRVDLISGQAELLDSELNAFDPRLSPNGEHIAYVAGDELRIIDDAGDRLMIGEDVDTVSWGSAEFVAGEEMGRTRGFWWAPDSTRLLVERVDVSPVDLWWIASPVEPSREPSPIRYPAAGTPNCDVQLAILDLNGDRVDVNWNPAGADPNDPAAREWEYFADAAWTAEGLILTVQSRDQRTLAVLEVDPSDGSTLVRTRVTDDHWVELIPGVPRLHAGRLITVEDRGEARRLCVDGKALTGDEVQVHRVVASDEGGVVVVASTDSTTTDVGTVAWDGGISWLTDGDGLHTSVVGGPTEVRTCRWLRSATEFAVLRDGEAVGTLRDLAEQPTMSLNVSLHRLGPRRLASALLVPADHDGSPLPVLLDPYGGPHLQRVRQASSLFHASQWFADQGFAVLVTDGRGSPGRGPAFEREVWGDLAGPVLEDQIDALHAAAEAHAFMDLSRVVIRGWSFGGYLASLAVMRRPDIFHGAVAGASVTDWRLYDTHYTERYLGHPAWEPANYERTDICAEPARMGDRPMRPLMLIHGLADDNVVAAHTLQLSRALLEAGKPHSVLPLSGVTHMTPQEDVAENLFLVQLAFLRDALAVTP